MIELAHQIRAQLQASPNKKSFRKRRDTLLEIAIALEISNSAIRMLEQENRELKMAMRGEYP